jgi:hypothetical protein
LRARTLSFSERESNSWEADFARVAISRIFIGRNLIALRAIETPLS